VTLRSPHGNETTVALTGGSACSMTGAEAKVPFEAGTWTLDFHAYGMASSLAVKVSGA
jgi:hypothetical protein